MKIKIYVDGELLKLCYRLAIIPSPIPAGESHDHVTLYVHVDDPEVDKLRKRSGCNLIRGVIYGHVERMDTEGMWIKSYSVEGVK